MSYIANSARDRILVVDGVRHEIRPPTVREAIETLAAMDGMKDGNQESVRQFYLTIAPHWFPSEFLTVLDDMDAVEQMKCLSHLLYEGVRPGKKKKGDGSPPNWEDMIGLYSMAYRSDPWSVYNNVPFPFFLNMVNRADKQMARNVLSQVELFSLPHMGKKGDSVLRRLKMRAGYSTDASRAGSGKEVAEGRSRLKSLFGVQT